MIIADIIKIVSNFQRNTGIEIHKNPFQIDELFVKHIGEHLKLEQMEIRILDISTSSKIISGYIRRYENKIDIGIRENLNPCWTRFVTCKELSHVLMGNNGDGVTKNPRELVNGLYSALLFGKSDELDHEHLAMLCAAELMMPYDISQSLLEDNVITSPDIAQKFKIPLSIIQVYRNNDVLLTRREIYESL